ncbi:MAG TPA: hypothetical protein VLN74_17480 [Ilumatobacteraceae bacterium]|nr:hypothetical protein [Ilumatobacteraceae bacterium]
MLRRAILTGLLTVTALLTLAPTPTDANTGSGRMTVETPFRMIDTRPNRLTSIALPEGLISVTLVDPDSSGEASVRACGTARASSDPSVPLTPKLVSQLKVVGSNSSCLYTTASVSIIVDRLAYVVDEPAPGGSHYVGLPTPIGLHEATLGAGQHPLTQPAVVPADATAMVLSLSVGGEAAGGVGIGRCGDQMTYDLVTPAALPVTVAFARVGPGNGTPCIDVLGGPLDVGIELIGWLAPSGGDPTALPPMYSLSGGPSLEPGLLPINPDRALDTRNGIGCVDDGIEMCAQYNSKFVGDTTYRLDLVDYITPWTTALSLNVTATGPAGAGFLTVWPCGPIPETSSLNFDTGQTVANLVVASLDPDGGVCIRSTVDVHVLADVAGLYDFGFGEPMQTVTPERLLDTRNAIGVSGRSAVAADGVVALQVTGRGGVPAGAVAATMNLTAVSAAAAGYVTVWPCDAPRPDASNLNTVTGGTRPNLVTVALSASGTACIYSSIAVHLLADVAAWYGPGGVAGLVELGPARILDTRNAIGAPRAKLRANNVLTLQVVGRGGVDSDADSVIMNVTATGTEAAGYVTIWPCDAPQPVVSNLNFAAGETNPNSVSVKLSATGTVCLFSDATTDLIADVAGFTTSTPTEVVTLRLR